MHSVLLRLGEFQLHSYGVCLALGILFAYGVLVRLGRSRGFSSDRLANLLALLVVCGLAGARTFFVVEHWADYRADPASALRIWEGGLMFYGSIVFGAAALVAHCRITRSPMLPLLDLFAVAVPVGQAFGRVGCLLNGCCYGRPSDSCLAVTYPRWSIPCVEQIRAGLLPEDAARSLPVLPSQLFEAAGCLLLFLALLWLYRRLNPPAPHAAGTEAAPEARPVAAVLQTAGAGLVLAGWLAGYGVLRFLVETTRADERAHPFGGPLTISQTIGAGCILLAAALAAFVLFCNRKRPSA